ncbi:hypothetical protein FQZ97_1005890 [compost metagenome]
MDIHLTGDGVFIGGFDFDAGHLGLRLRFDRLAGRVFRSCFGLGLGLGLRFRFRFRFGFGFGSGRRRFHRFDGFWRVRFDFSFPCRRRYVGDMLRLRLRPGRFSLKRGGGQVVDDIQGRAGQAAWHGRGLFADVNGRRPQAR